MAGPSKQAKEKLRRALYEAHGPLCWLCKQAMSFDVIHPHPHSITVDHVLPVSLKGTWDTWNLRLAHNACNQARANSIDPADISDRISRLLRGEPNRSPHRRPRKAKSRLEKQPFEVQVKQVFALDYGAKPQPPKPAALKKKSEYVFSGKRKKHLYDREAIISILDQLSKEPVEKEKWAFYVDGQKVIGRTYFD